MSGVPKTRVQRTTSDEEGLITMSDPIYSGSGGGGQSTTTHYSRSTIEEIDDDEDDPESGLPFESFSKTSENRFWNFCLSNRAALIGVIGTVALVSLLVLVLDLTILEVERWERYKFNSQYYTGKSGDEPTSPDELYGYRINGTEDHYVTFEQIPYHISEFSLNFLELEYVEINPTIFFKALKWCRNLRVLKLINVKFFGRLDVLGSEARIFLPFLKEFVLQASPQPIGPKESFKLGSPGSEDCSLQAFSTETFSSLKSPDCLKALIFFRKEDPPQTFDLESIHKLNTNIKISLFGWIMYSLNHEERELTSMLPYSDRLIRAIADDPSGDLVLRKVNVEGCTIDSRTLVSLAPTLTHLELLDVSVQDLKSSNTSSRLSETISKMTHLESLSHVAERRLGPITGSQELEARSLPTSLKRLVLANTVLVFHPLDPGPNPRAPHQLDDLVLICVHFTGDGLSSGISSFIRAKRVIWWDLPSSQRAPGPPAPSPLLNLIEVGGAEELMVINFDRNWYAPFDEQARLVTFFRNAGLSPNPYTGTSIMNVKKEGEKWNGTEIPRTTGVSKLVMELGFAKFANSPETKASVLF